VSECLRSSPSFHHREREEEEEEFIISNIRPTERPKRIAEKRTERIMEGGGVWVLYSLGTKEERNVRVLFLLHMKHSTALCAMLSLCFFFFPRLYYLYKEEYDIFIDNIIGKIVSLNTPPIIIESSAPMLIDKQIFIKPKEKTVIGLMKKI
jgi:hypothetical protein